jgi:quinol monooxygenase YgiN/catechol 2,3-dioxygenase-like lactoylglutathione lyase family enzyme
MSTPSHNGIHHIKLPVTDLERSTEWYSTVLGARRLTQLDHRRPDGTLFAVILDVPGVAGRVELRLAPATAKSLNGYDFLTLTVADKSTMDTWVDRLDSLGVRHSPLIVALVGWLLVVPDPDGLRLRFYTTEPHSLGTEAVEFDSPWLGAGITAEPDDVVSAIGRLTVLPGHEAEVLDLMRTVADATRQEDGCLAYELHRAKDNPSAIVVYESWTSRDAMAAHHRSAHMDLFKKSAASLVEWPPQAELLTPEA